MAPRDDIPYLLRAPAGEGANGLGRQGREELLSYPAGLLSKLPVESRITLYLPDLVEEVWVYTRELPEPREAVEGVVVFDGVELAALVRGVEAERFWATDLRRLCRGKVADPELRLTLEEALSGAQPVGEPMSLGALLRRLSATLAGVELGPFLDSELTRAA